MSRFPVKFCFLASILLFCLLEYTAVTAQTLRVTSNTENRLINDLLREYSTNVRPVFNSSKIVYIHYHMRLSRILQIDERNEILTTAWWLEQRWHDDYLTWDPVDYDNITQINIPTTMIWIPDTVLYNSADVDKEPGTGVMKTNAMVSYDGDIFWQAPAIFKSSCKLNITYFPFDVQNCNLKFGPWTYLGNEVIMKQVADSGDFSQMSLNGQWELIRMPVEEHLIKYGCCPIPYSDIEFYIILRRKALFYVFNLVFPSVFMSLISLLSFHLPPASGEKVGLNITILLSLVFFLLLGAQLLPPTSDTVSLLGKLFSTIIAIMSLETVMSVIILRLYHREPRNSPPALVRWLILDKAASFLRMKGRYHEFSEDDDLDSTSYEGATSDPFEFDSKRATFNSKSIGSSLLQKLRIDVTSFADVYSKEKRSSEDSDYGSEISDDSIGSTIMRIGNYLNRLVMGHRKKETCSAIQQQWIDLCIVLDRILLILFSTALVIGCLAIIVQMTEATRKILS